MSDPASSRAAAPAIPALTGVRGLAALWVLLHHVHPRPEAIAAVCELGYLGVDLFGFLSGFVITLHYGERLAGAPGSRGVALRYWWARFARIAPLYYLALALLVVARYAVPGFESRPTAGPQLDWFGATGLAEQLLMVQGWGIGTLCWNLPSWTVSAEWLCYLLFPLLVPALVRVRTGPVAAALAVVTLAITVESLRLVGHPDLNSATDWGALRIGGEFLAGCWLQRAWAAGFARRAPWSLLAPAALGGAVAMTALQQPAAVVACFLVLVYGLAHDRGPLARGLASRPLLLLGEASYALYILHWVVLRTLVHAAPGRAGGDPVWQAGLDVGIVVVVSLVAYRWIEGPARRELRRWVAPA